MFSINQLIETIRADVNTKLQEIIAKQEDRMKLEYALKDGKRLRPTLMVLVFKSCKGEDYDKVLATAASLELQHSASLIHDDIIDKTSVRRGKPSYYQAYGISDGILIGHRMIWLGFYTILNHGLGILKTVLDCWNSTLKGEMEQAMIDGQKRNDRPLHSRTFYQEVVLSKTASLFAAAAKLGAQEAGASEELQRQMEQFGKHLGIAYQCADDVVDLQREKVEPSCVDVTGLLIDKIKSEMEIARRSFDPEILDPKYAEILVDLPTLFIGQMLSEKGREGAL